MKLNPPILNDKINSENNLRGVNLKTEIGNLFNICMDNATEEELEVLLHLLHGINKKQSIRNVSFIDNLLHLEKVINHESCEITIPLSSLLNNSLGIVHGGIIATLIDTAMGTLANSLLPDGFGAVTTQLNIHYLAVGKGDYLQCKAQIDHKGTKTMVLSATVHRADGKKIAQASGSFFIVAKK